MFLVLVSPSPILLVLLPESSGLLAFISPLHSNIFIFLLVFTGSYHPLYQPTHLTILLPALFRVLSPLYHPTYLTILLLTFSFLCSFSLTSYSSPNSTFPPLKPLQNQSPPPVPTTPNNTCLISFFPCFVCSLTMTNLVPRRVRYPPSPSPPPPSPWFVVLTTLSVSSCWVLWCV